MDLVQYHYKHGAFCASPHRLSGRDRMNPEKTMSGNKMFFPKTDWSGTSDVMHTCEEKTCERTKKKTSE